MLRRAFVPPSEEDPRKFRRAFVVAVEKYDPNSPFRDLPGVNAAAEDFLRWLIDTIGVNEIVCCASGLNLPRPSKPPGPIFYTYGCTRGSGTGPRGDRSDIAKSGDFSACPYCQ